MRVQYNTRHYHHYIMNIEYCISSDTLLHHISMNVFFDRKEKKMMTITNMHLQHINNQNYLYCDTNNATSNVLWFK